jgi:hypothetical protein
MAITEDKKNIPNLRFATGLRPMELQKTIGDLKNEGAIAFNKQANEWELTPTGVENVRAIAQPKVARARRGDVVPVQQPPTREPGGEGAGVGAVVPPSGPVERLAEREIPPQPAVADTATESMPLREAMLVLEREVDEERQTAQTKAKPVDDMARRKSELSSRAIDALDSGKITEQRYNKIVEKLKAPVPRFGDVEALLAAGRGAVKYQQGETPTAPKVTPERVNAAVSNAVRGWANPPKIVVARNATDSAIPEQYRDQIPDDTKGFYVDGTTYVLADRATDEAGVVGTVFHESLGHYGLEQEFQGGLRGVMQAIYDTNPAMKREANARMQKGKSLDAPTAVEEVLASRSERGEIKEGGIRAALNRVRSYIRNFLRRMGFDVNYSNNDVDQILQQAHRRVIELRKAPYSPFDPSIRYQRSPKEQRDGDIRFINSIGQIPERLPAATKETLEDARNAASKLPSATRRALFGFYNAHDMDRLYGMAPGGQKVTNGYAKIWKALNEQGAYLFKLKSQITENVQAWNKVMDKFSPAEKDRIFNLFMDTTVDQIEVLDLVDGSRNINWTADKKSPVYKEFQKLPPEVKEVYKSLRLAYMDYSLAVENALKQYLTPNEWQKLQNKFNERRLGVYLPLYRKGNFKLRYVDKNGDTVALQFESPRERALAKQEAIRQGVDRNNIIESEVGSKNESQVPPSEFFSDVVGRLTKAKVDPDVVTSVVEAYLDLLPAKSVLQLSRKRQRDEQGRGLRGYSNNVLEAYANIGSSYANRVSNITYGNKFNEAKMEIIEDLSNAVDANKLDAGVAEDIKTALNKQMDFIQNPNLGGYGAMASYASFHLFLGANLSTAVVNVFDIVTVTLSRLGGKYKYAPAMTALMNASGMFFNKNLSPEMQKLIQIGTDSGALRVQQLSDLAEFQDMDSKYARLKAGTERISNWAFAKSDMFNRQTTFVAAYNLSKAKRGKVPDGQIDPEAVADADRAVYDVYGSSFPKANIPIMGSDLARVALTFKTFGIRRLQLLANAYREAAKGESKEVRDAARKELIGYFGTAFVFAGVQGMPVVGAGMGLVSILNGILGDDDDPYDVEFAMRDAIGLFNYKGPINYLLGVDIASRTGWTGMFWREDPKRMAEVGPATYVLEQLMGPTFAYGAGLIKDGGALDNIFIEGKFQRGFEQLLPRSLANPLKARRYAIEGATTANGAPLVDDVNRYNQFMQVFGFRPSDVAEAGEEAGAAKRMESKIRQRRSAIISRAALAQMSGDSDAFYQAVQEASAFSSKNPSVAITPKVLRDAIKRRQKKLIESVNGVTVDRKLAMSIYDELGIDPYE